MPYTAAQLTAYYTAVNQGVVPDAATQLLLNAYATQDAAGTLTDAQTLFNALHTAQTTAGVDVATATYAFFTGTVPSAAGLGFLVNSSTNTTDLGDTYYAQFNQENRYYNFAINLALGSASATTFSTTYSALTLAQTVATAYEAIVGSTNVGATAAAAAIASITASIPYFQSVAATRAAGLNQDLATKAIIIAYILEEGVKADVGTYAKAIDQFNADIAGGVAIYGPGTALTTTYIPGGAGYGIGIGGSGSVVGGTPGSTFAFTGAIDNLVGTANDDTFNGAIITNATATLFTTFQAADSVVGNGGNDTLNIAITDAAGGATGAIAVPAAGVSGVRNIFVRGTSTTAADIDTVVAGNFSGAVQFVDDRSTNAVTFTGLAAGQALGINGNAAATIGAVVASYGATVTAETLNLTGGTGNSATPSVGPAVTITTGASAVVTATINSSGAANVLGAVQLNAAGSITTLNVAANTAVTVGGISGLGSALASTSTETLNVTGVAAVTLGGLTGANNNISTFNINVNNGSTLNTGVLSAGFFAGGAANTINVNGTATTVTANTAAVTLGAIDASVKTLNASGLTAGGVSATIGANAAIAFTGGAGTDVVTVAAGTGAALTGAIAGGAGTDIIAFTTGADLASNLTSLVTSFEVLRVSNAGAVGTNQTYDPTLITGITAYQVGASVGGVTFNNLVANAAVTVIGNDAGTGAAGGAGLVLNLANAGGSTDVVNLTLNNLATTGTNVNGVIIGVNGASTGGLALGGNGTAGQIETLNIASAGRVAGTGVYNSVTLVGGAGPNFPDATNVKITGAAGLYLQTGATQHATNIDASAATGGVIIDAATQAVGAGGSFTIIGSAVNDTILSANVSSIYGGAGGDSIVLGAGVQTVVYKAATDSQLDLTGTYVNVAAVTNNTPTNTGNVGASGTGGVVNTSKMDIITNFATGMDKIDVSTFGFGTGALGGGLGGDGGAGGATATSDAAFTTLLTASNLFSDGVLTRGIAQIHGTAGMSSGVAGDFIIVDVNKDGVYTAGSDLVFKLQATASVVIGDFNV